MSHGRPPPQAQQFYASNAFAHSSSTTNLLPPDESAQPSSRNPFAQLAGPPASSAVRRQQAQAALGAAASTPPTPTSSASLLPSAPAHGRSTSISGKFSLAPDPSLWDPSLRTNDPEPDDYLHNPDPKRDRKYDQGGTIFTARGLSNLGCLLVLACGIVTLFAGYPIISYFKKHPLRTFGGFGFGGTNSTGQVPKIPGNWGLVDLETPDSALTRPSFNDPSKTLTLVFSDEFNTAGRSFYPGDDPYWEAVDLHYWETGNMEWYDPAAVTTNNGALEITLSQKQTHGLDYQGGMVATWNKFCFTGGLLETSVTLPGINNVVGLWPAVWTMGNLGRAGYGASLDGMWPYTYDSCDVGTVANQTVGGLPQPATTNGDPSRGGALSWLAGQRLSRCTCPGESHPGPMHSDGTFVGRSAPEIDVFEAVASDKGYVSQTCQFAPFNEAYKWNQNGNYQITNTSITNLNSYLGGAIQMAVSALTQTAQDCYQLGTGCFSVYGFEYKPGFDDAYITWINNNVTAWTLMESGMGADTAVEIGPRPIPQEPLYIIMNLGMSTSFGAVDTAHLTFPSVMRVDYVRVYQDASQYNIGCDPPDFPTAAYINQYLDAYVNPNLTTWTNDFGQPVPKNTFLKQC
ncbi:glycoside hydrolase family 16 protein [Auriscalpium vulgare]|uniref:Glycoside hydrolase family 16 protein n=1 Tax=Auriscalpium vulgare TaxID=40419 RepID=A0ACB8RCF7_9AGAM|nr:glycoside hydrolase family 16 protein [Auriscalpium vulgare]